MKCVLPTEVSKWLERAGLLEHPHHAHLDDLKDLLHAQFYVPRDYAVVRCFANAYVQQVATDGDLLIHVYDWDPFEGPDCIIFNGIRQIAGESRDLDQVPGHLISAGNRDEAIAVFRLTSVFGWKSYLYSDHDQLVLHNWEGEIYDVWTTSDARLKAVDRIVQTFGFKPVPYE